MEKNDMYIFLVDEESDPKQIAHARAVFRIDADKFIEKIQEMDDTELANEIIKHPEMGEYIFPFVDDLSAFYDEIKECYIPTREVASDNEVHLNRWVPVVLREIKRYITRELHYKDFDEYEEARYKKIEYDNFKSALYDMISYGYPPEGLIDFCELQGYDFDDLYDATSLKYAYENNYIDEYSIDDITRAIEAHRKSKNSDNIENQVSEEEIYSEEEIEILMEAEGEYLDYLDSFETYKMGNNPEIDKKINECLKQGYLPSYIDTILEDYGYTLSPEDLKEMYYKCGFEYDIETGAARKIEDKKSLLQSKEDELSRLEAEERTISEAEALMDKQTGKDGQDIGEE